MQKEIKFTTGSESIQIYALMVNPILNLDTFMFEVWARKFFFFFPPKGFKEFSFLPTFLSTWHQQKTFQMASFLYEALCMCRNKLTLTSKKVLFLDVSLLPLSSEVPQPWDRRSLHQLWARSSPLGGLSPPLRHTGWGQGSHCAFPTPRCLHAARLHLPQGLLLPLCFTPSYSIYTVTGYCPPPHVLSRCFTCVLVHLWHK